MTQALSSEDRARRRERAHDVEVVTPPKRPRYRAFQAAQFGSEFSIMLALAALQSWLMPDSRDVGLSAQSGITAAMLLLPVWYLAQGLYRLGGPVAAVRVHRRVLAVGAAFTLIGVQSLLLKPTLDDTLLLLFLLVVGLGIGLLMEGIIRPTLARVLQVRVPALVLGDGEFRQLTGELLMAGADFGGVAPTGNPGDDSVVPWAGVPALTARSRPGLSAPAGEITSVILPAPARPDGATVEVNDLGGFLGVVYRFDGPSPVSMAVKITIDKLVAGTALLAFLPAILLIAAALKILSPGPIFYSQTRIGQDGRPFRMWKFRTMRVNAEQYLQEHLEANPEAMAEWKTFFKLKKDPRIVPGIGAFLRKSSLDELPQLFNVLNGTMSLVGPRPFPTYHLEQFPLPFQRLRTTVRPGMTGFWQISARSDGDLRVQEALDTYYIRNWSIWLDLHILATTPYAMLANKGAY